MFFEDVKFKWIIISFLMGLNLITPFKIKKRMTIPCKILNNNEYMPMIGLKTFEEYGLEDPIMIQISSGFRMIDSAAVRLNEDSVGAALHDLYRRSQLQRDDFFLIGKLWNTFHKPEFIQEAISLTLASFGTTYLDLYLIHWPMAYQRMANRFPKISSEDTSVTLEETWQGMEELVRLNFTKGIGLANFNLTQIKRIMKIAKIKPAVIMTEVNVYMIPHDIIDYCYEQNIAVLAAHPIYGLKRPQSIRHNLNMYAEPIILELADKYEKSPLQIILRFLIDLGTVPIVPMMKKPMILEKRIFDFRLEREEIKKVSKLNFHLRSSVMLTCINFTEYPFVEYREIFPNILR